VKASRWSARKRQEWATAYAFLLPDTVGLFVFVFLPILYAFYVSLHRWNAFSPRAFIGLDNYAALLADDRWWHSLGRTFLFSAVYVPLLFVLALGAAVMVNALGKKTANAVRTMILMPFAITSVISAIIGVFLLDPRTGLINQLFRQIGWPAQQFLGSPSQALYCIVAVLLWINLGYNMVIFLASIKEIPRDYYEAANLDGASGWQAFRYITFPLLRGTSTFILIVTLIGSFQVLDQIMVMTKGGPVNSTQVSAYYIYKVAFEQMNMGYSSALAFALFIIIFVLSLVQLKLLTRE